jgi:hypothetical protein
VPCRHAFAVKVGAVLTPVRRRESMAPEKFARPAKNSIVSSTKKHKNQKRK